MSQFTELIQALKSESYRAKKQLLDYLLRFLQQMQAGRKKLDAEDKAALLDYAYGEIRVLPEAIAAAGSYREKDLLFVCEDLLMGLVMHLCPDPAELPQEQMVNIRLLAALVERERYLETALDKLFAQSSISEEDMAQLLSLASQTRDEYQRGQLYVGLLHYREELGKLTDGARGCVAAYLAHELRRYLAQEPLEDECRNNLEVMADISRHFADDGVIGLLREVMALGHHHINFYAVTTLLSLGQEVSAQTVQALARDMEYANLTYGTLAHYGKQSLFPPECATPEYLAKSDMVHWLMYPTELGKAPDEIEYIGKVSYLLKKEVYHVFRFRSDSDTLDEEMKNRWLIGWSSEDGGTFSNFDAYDLYEKESTEATLKNIKKKLLG